MLKIDPENWVICLFVDVFASVVLYALWPYIVAANVLYAIVKGFTSTHHDSNLRRKCRRRCRRRRRW